MMILAVASVFLCLTGLVYFGRAWVMAAWQDWEKQYTDRAMRYLDSLQADIDAKIIFRMGLVAAAVGGLISLALSLPAYLAAGLCGMLSLAPFAVLSRLKTQRRAAFEQQLPELISLVRSAVSCGYSLPMAFQLAQRKITAPARDELAIFNHGLRMGLTLEEAFERLRERMPGQDLDILMNVLLVVNRTGGSLSQILENLEQTVRERLRLKMKLEAMTSKGRMEAIIIGIAPVILGAGIYVLQPEMMSGFVADPYGMLILAVCAFWMSLGIYFIRKILIPKF